jgi:NAD(P)-dependent dehydrogenase (short-subunit alcohol dehydrogenase family)
MPSENVTTPVVTGVKTHFLTAIAAARHMVQQRSGVILTLSSSAAGLSGRDRRYHLTGGFAIACAAIEALTRSLAGELGPQGIRVVCLRSDAIPETWPTDHIESRTYMENGTVLGRLPTLDEVANAAVFLASDRASAMTGTIANLTCGSIMD